MSSIVVAGDTSGTVTLQAPAVAGSTVLTLPAVSGTVMVNGSAFSAYVGTTQAITSNTWTKLAANTEEFDTNSNYDNATNYRFTPTVSGYYQVTGNIYFNATLSTTGNRIAIYKNGTLFKYGSLNYPASAPADTGTNMSSLIYLNGSTDYVELYGLVIGTGALTISNTSSLSYFQAAMIRSA
jgi:hypothetical protein